MKKNLYTLEGPEDGPQILCRNGMQQMCPHIGTIAVLVPAHTAGGIITENKARPAPMQTQCNTNCALFDLQGDGKRAKLCCSVDRVILLDSQPDKTEQKPTLNLIN